MFDPMYTTPTELRFMKTMKSNKCDSTLPTGPEARSPSEPLRSTVAPAGKRPRVRKRKPGCHITSVPPPYKQQ